MQKALVGVMANTVPLINECCSRSPEATERNYLAFLPMYFLPMLNKKVEVNVNSTGGTPLSLWGWI